ncbi:response regulator [Caulobacter vibrioides]|uniref:ATP-binding protein n=1 Tax=Caulobacter vibrioides TaxID=155892 RepID=UPI000BB4E2EE|nr:ATP-binding protein [Caulobacter vibrioides]ATC26076.1 PAS domain S-box protein [Caulobacter vibrioides]AZH14215.1 response regulator [Caulobacter vibrioides]PLR16801.1 PAS domain S-box protein [Caulobacter vibrioides]
MGKRLDTKAGARIEAAAADWFFQNSLDMFVVLRDSRIIRANPAWSQLTGWAAEDTLGREIRDFFHLHDTEVLTAAGHTLKTVGHAHSENRLARKGGGWLWVRTQSTILEGGGQLIVFQDISEDRAREAARLQAERSNELLRNAAGVYVWRFNPRRGVYAFDQDIPTPSAPEGGARTMTVAEMTQSIHPEDSARVWQAFSRTLQTGEHVEIDYRYLDPGADDWIHLHVAWRGVRGSSPDTYDVIGITQNVTELVAARDAALAAAETKSQFLANMSHEIRTPMNGVLGVLHLLKTEKLSDDGRRLLTEALGCGEMLSELLNDIIDFSKIEAGKLELSAEPICPAELLRGVADMLRAQAEAKGLYLRVEASDDLGWVATDPLRLRQALFNLIGNAVKFTLEGGVVARLSGRRIDSPDGARLRLRFEIDDTGVGIGEEAGARLFERFRQGDGSTTRRFGGSGLGLAICRRLAELMGGEVGFESQLGKGSTFWLEVETQACARPDTQETLADGPLFDGLHVLLVEDNATNRLIATRMLEALGARVTTAEDGAQGVTAARQGFDLILMDIQMPVMDGVEATHRIRAFNNPAGAAPILAMTANAMAHQQASYLAAGMDGAIAKPLSPLALTQAIAAALTLDPSRQRKAS